MQNNMVNVFDNNNTQSVHTATRINVTMVNSSNNYCDYISHARLQLEVTLVMLDVELRLVMVEMLSHLT